jgi:signal transduction histidine kinase
MTYPEGQVPFEPSASGRSVTAPEPWRDSVSRATLTVCAVVAPLLAAFGLVVESTQREAPDIAVLVSAGVLLPLFRFWRRVHVRRRATAAILIMFAAAVYLTARAGFAAGLNGVVVSASTSLLAVLLALVTDLVIRRVEANARATAAALRQLRGAQEHAQEAQRILAELGAVLSPLRYESSLTDVAPLVARNLADLVVFFVVQADGELHRVAAATRDPAQAWIADAIMTSLRATVRPDHPARRVVRDRQPFIRQFAPESLEEAAESPEHLRTLRALRLRSSMVVPLVVGDDCQGALGLSSSSHAFDEADLPLALEIGRRCALFIENARLHRSEKAAIQARDEVVAIVAHDLRSPLATMMFQLAVLRHPSGKAERRSMETIEALEHSTRRMSRILEDLLDVTRLEAGQLELSRARVSPAEIIAEISGSQREQVRSRSLELRTEVAPDLPDVWADRSRALQVFENLIGNAIKFTTEGGIVLGARVQMGDGDGDGEVVFWVADTGVGIAAEDVGHVFDRFWQARRSRRSGAGLGLAIVREIVQAHGGRLWVDSALGAGSTFFFTLPTANPSSI